MSTKEKAKKYLDLLLSVGAEEIKVTWEGGNDEGSFYVYIDGKDTDIDYTRKDGTYDLVDFIADEIGYGSFAGDYNANGEVIYDVEQGAFIGEDDCEMLQDYNYKFKKPLVFPILKELWFDSVLVDISGYSEDMDISVRLSISNGPVFEEHMDFESNAVKVLEKEIYRLFDTIDEVRDVWYNQEFGRDNLGVDKDGNFLLAITGLTYNKYVSEVKDIVIQL